MEDFLAVSSTLLAAAPGRKNVELHGTLFLVQFSA